MANVTDSFFSLGAVFWTNLVLSGDNAILIALACRNLPDTQRRLGMVLGAAVAIALRIGFSGLAVQILGIPGIKLIGGLVLLWIATDLAVGGESEAPQVNAADRLWHAIRAIALADIVMSLDNVLAIVSVAQGNFSVIVVGLAMSIPMIVWGAEALSRVIARWPALVKAAAAILGWSAGLMAFSDSLASPLMRLAEISLGASLDMIAGLTGAGLALIGGVVRRQPITLRGQEENF